MSPLRPRPCPIPSPPLFFLLLCIASTLLLLCSPAAAEHYLTSETGGRVGSNQHSQSMTASGPLLLQHVYALEKLRRFNSERLAERVVHARGVAALGTFISHKDLSDLTSSSIFSGGNRQTEVVVRFSTVIHGKHSPETLRDPRGFAIKFKTETQGNWDLAGNNLPVFFIRDHLKFPDMVHSLKPDPVTNIQDPNRFFDFFAAMGGMATNMLTYLYSDLGIPKGYRFMQGNSVHAYKFVNKDGKVTYVKLRWVPHVGTHNLTRAQATKTQGMDFNHATRDLIDAIKMGKFPKWTMRLQTMSVEDLDKQDFNALDATKIWPEDQFPFVDIGTLILNAIPGNFHLGSELSSFDPGNFPMGHIEPSEDKLLQGRLLSYHETQTHRHRSNNFQQLPINKPKSPVKTYNQDGVMPYAHAWNGTVNYEPSLGTAVTGNAGAVYKEDERYMMSKREFCGSTVQESIEKTRDFKQAGQLWRSFSMRDRKNLIGNMAADLGAVRSMTVKNTMCSHFYRADANYGRRLCDAVGGCDLGECKRLAGMLKW